MNHKDKNKGTRRQKTGALLVIPFFFNLYLFAWVAKGAGDEGRLPPARSLRFSCSPVDQSAKLWSWPWPSSINFLAARS